jgi:hypothetical protein
MRRKVCGGRFLADSVDVEGTDAIWRETARERKFTAHANGLGLFPRHQPAVEQLAGDAGRRRHRFLPQGRQQQLRLIGRQRSDLVRLSSRIDRDDGER